MYVCVKYPVVHSYVVTKSVKDNQQIEASDSNVTAVVESYLS